MNAGQTAGVEPRQILTFVVGQESYGIDILSVREIRGWAGTTYIPKTAATVLGVINLRGEIVPVMDMRLCFANGPAEYNQMTVVIIVAIRGSAQARLIGIVVDAVSEVLDITQIEIKPVPAGAFTASDYISGLLTSSERMITLLDMEKWIHATLQ